MKRRIIKSEKNNFVGTFVQNKALNIDGAEISYAGRCITPYIPVPSNCKRIQFCGGFTSSDSLHSDGGSVLDAYLIEYNADFSFGTYWANTDHKGGRTFDVYNFGRTQHIRFTIRSDRMQYAYLKDVTNNQTLFDGKDYVK